MGGHGSWRRPESASEAPGTGDPEGLQNGQLPINGVGETRRSLTQPPRAGERPATLYAGPHRTNRGKSMQ